MKYNFLVYSIALSLSILNYQCPLAKVKPDPVKLSFDSLFTEISFTTFHIFPSRFIKNDKIKSGDIQLLGKRIFPKVALKIDPKLKNHTYYALNKFYFDGKREFIGYLIGEGTKFNQKGRKINIYLYVFSKKTQKKVFDIKVASYAYLNSAYEEILNSWITDINEDNILDIALYYKILDFELPAQSNISETKKYIYLFQEGKFEYNYWQSNKLTNITLKK